MSDLAPRTSQDATNASASSDLAAPLAQRRSPRSPAYLICLLLFVLADAFSGQKLGLPLPVGPDRVLFGFFIVLIACDRSVDWSSWRLRSSTVIGALTLLWAIGSAYTHGTLATSLGGFALLDRLFVPYLLFALAPVAFSTARSRMLLLQVLAVLGLYLGVTAIFEIIGPHALVFPRYIADPNVGISYGRARGPFLASDADAAAMAICFFANYALWAQSSSRAWRQWAIVSSLFCVVGVFLALTRAEWIGTGLGIVAVGLLVPSFRRKIPAALALIAAVLALLLITVPSLRTDASSRADYSRSVFDRQNTDLGGLRALEGNPLTGIGWEEFIATSPRYVRQARTYPITSIDIEIHNVALSRLAELGLIGGSLWILSVLLGPVAALLVGRRRHPLDDAYRIAFVGVAIVWLIAIQFSPFSYPLPNALVWMLAGIVLAPLEPSGCAYPRWLLHGRSGEVA